MTAIDLIAVLALWIALSFGLMASLARGFRRLPPPEADAGGDHPDPDDPFAFLSAPAAGRSTAEKGATIGEHGGERQAGR